jgi:hypothetical protein
VLSEQGHYFSLIWRETHYLVLIRKWGFPARAISDQLLAFSQPNEIQQVELTAER